MNSQNSKVKSKKKNERGKDTIKKHRCQVLFFWNYYSNRHEHLSEVMAVFHGSMKIRKEKAQTVMNLLTTPSKTKVWKGSISQVLDT